MERQIQLRCGQCGIEFDVPEWFYKAKKCDSTTWFCPAGHRRHFPQGETEADKLRRERDQLMQRVAYKDDEIARQRVLREAAERSASAYKGQVTKIKKRAGKGVCPCCNRSFDNLKRHMESKHPDFADSDTVVAFPKAATQ